MIAEDVSIFARFLNEICCSFLKYIFLITLSVFFKGNFKIQPEIKWEMELKRRETNKNYNWTILLQFNKLNDEKISEDSRKLRHIFYQIFSRIFQDHFETFTPFLI